MRTDCRSQPAEPGPCSEYLYRCRRASDLYIPNPFPSMPPFPLKAHVLDVRHSSPNVRHMKKESILGILNKLGERDTQQTAIDELRREITVI